MLWLGCSMEGDLRVPGSFKKRGLRVLVARLFKWQET